MNVLVCAGGTGGHIYPALAAVSELYKLGLSSEQILWLGVQGEMEEQIVPQAGLTMKQLQGGPIVGVPIMTQMKNGLKLAWSMAQAMKIMSDFKPDVLFLTGGYISAPVTAAAKLRRVPAIVYLPDIEPGSAIKKISRLVQTVACTFEASGRYFPAGKTVATGYPIRPELKAAVELSRPEALAQFKLTPERPTLFVTGGSRGAWSINKALMDALPELLTEIQVIHVSGTLTWPKVEALSATLTAAQKRYYRPYPYLHAEMGAAYRAADLVVARAGASTLGEGPFFGIPSILVPYPHAWRYQKVNADYLAERGAAVRLNDELLETELSSTILNLMQNAEQLKQMAQSAQALDVPNAAGKLARLIMETGRRRKDA